MEFRQLEAFTAVAGLKSFSRAADYLYLSQSTVSTHIKNLEEELQKKLLIRTAKSLKLTPEGEIFLRYANRILETKQAAVDAISDTPETNLSLGASTIPSGYMLPQLLNRFHQKHPSTYFNVRRGDSRDIQESILDGTVEVGLIGEADNNKKCIYLPFCTDQLVLATPATEYYLSLQKQNPDIMTLLKEPVIMREQGSGTQKAADRLFSELNINDQQLHVIARVNDPESIKQMIVEGLGISVLSRFAAADLESRGQIITYSLIGRVQRYFYITYLKSKKLTPALQEFINFVMNYYQSRSAPD